jgi:hypothetical protein
MSPLSRFQTGSFHAAVVAGARLFWDDIFDAARVEREECKNINYGIALKRYILFKS